MLQNFNLRLVATGILLLCLVTSAFADMQTITLNTGYNHAANSVYVRPYSPWAYPLPALVNHKDAYWTLVYDPNTNGGTPIPRRSDIIARYPVWQPEMANSEWISFERNGNPTGQSPRFYVFEKCFCLKRGFNQGDGSVEKTVMDLQLRADDGASVYLNQTLSAIVAGSAPSILQTSISSGGFNNPTPAATALRKTTLTSQLKTGRNCLQVKLQDTGFVVSGFNLTGSITAKGIDQVAATPTAANSSAQFNNCSACFPKISFLEPADQNVPF